MNMLAIFHGYKNLRGIQRTMDYMIYRQYLMNKNIHSRKRMLKISIAWHWSEGGSGGVGTKKNQKLSKGSPNRKGNG